jgi:hypothetical protein
MRKTAVVALILSLVMAWNVYASQYPEGITVIATSPGAISSTEASLNVEMEGMVYREPVIISVLMPTKIYFQVLPAEDNWNKILSPVITASNLGSSDVRLSVIKANAVGTTLTTVKPTGNEIRLGIAPESMISESSLSSTYLLRTSLTTSRGIDLGIIGFSTPSNKASYKLFGDVAANAWLDGDRFTVNAVFKVNI